MEGNDMHATGTLDGAGLMRELVPRSPFAVHLGIELAELDDGRAVLRLPFRQEVVTLGSTVHGGAIATLVDTAAMAAAWAGAEVPDPPRGSTVALTVDYLAPADGCGIEAVATVVRRGRRLTTVRVDAHADNTHVATALVTYQIG
jgi:uncharacterized protein (TIGR00369 family)